MGINDFIQVGSNIKRIRKERNLTQREVARMLGIPFSTYSNYENNHREPNFEMLSNISRILNVPIHQLVSDISGEDETEYLFNSMTSYLDELGLSLEQDDSDIQNNSYQIVSVDRGTIGRYEFGTLIQIFLSIEKDADLRKDNYIKNRLKAEFIEGD